MEGINAREQGVRGHTEGLRDWALGARGSAPRPRLHGHQSRVVPVQTGRGLVGTLRQKI